MPEDFLMFKEMNTPAAAEGYVPDNRHRYIRKTELDPIIPGSTVVHKFYLIDPDVNNVEFLSKVDIQYAFGVQKLFEKTVAKTALVQLPDACEVIVTLFPIETEKFTRTFPEINVYKKPYINAHCQLIVTKRNGEVDGEVIYSEIQEVRVELPLQNYVEERILEKDDT